MPKLSPLIFLLVLLALTTIEVVTAKPKNYCQSKDQGFDGTCITLKECREKLAHQKGKKSRPWQSEGNHDTCIQLATGQGLPKNHFVCCWQARGCRWLRPNKKDNKKNDKTTGKRSGTLVEGVCSAKPECQKGFEWWKGRGGCKGKSGCCARAPKQEKPDEDERDKPRKKDKKKKPPKKGFWDKLKGKAGQIKGKVGDTLSNIDPGHVAAGAGVILTGAVAGAIVGNVPGALVGAGVAATTLA